MNYLHKQNRKKKKKRTLLFQVYCSFGFEIPDGGATCWPVWGRAKEMARIFRMEETLVGSPDLQASKSDLYSPFLWGLLLSLPGSDAKDNGNRS